LLAFTLAGLSCPCLLAFLLALRILLPRSCMRGPGINAARQIARLVDASPLRSRPCCRREAASSIYFHS
jgi:hypothetical protein